MAGAGRAAARGQPATPSSTALLDRLQAGLPAPAAGQEPAFAAAGRPWRRFDPAGLSPCAAASGGGDAWACRGGQVRRRDTPRRCRSARRARSILRRPTAGRGRGGRACRPAPTGCCGPRAWPTEPSAIASRGCSPTPAYLYTDDDAGRDKAVADMNAWLARIRPRLARAFGDLPIPPAEARRMSAAGRGQGPGRLPRGRDLRQARRLLCRPQGDPRPAELDPAGGGSPRADPRPPAATALPDDGRAASPAPALRQRLFRGLGRSMPSNWPTTWA